MRTSYLEKTTRYCISNIGLCHPLPVSFEGEENNLYVFAWKGQSGKKYFRLNEKEVEQKIRTEDEI